MFFPYIYLHLFSTIWLKKFIDTTFTKYKLQCFLTYHLTEYYYTHCGFYIAVEGDLFFQGSILWRSSPLFQWELIIIFFSYFTHNFWRFFQESEIAEPFLSLPLKNVLSIRKTQNFIWVYFQIHTCKMHVSSFKTTEILSFFSSNESMFFFIISFWRFPLFPWFRWCFCCNERYWHQEI